MLRCRPALRAAAVPMGVALLALILCPGHLAYIGGSVVFLDGHREKLFGIGKTRRQFVERQDDLDDQGCDSNDSGPGESFPHSALSVPSMASGSKSPATERIMWFGVKRSR